MGFKSFAYLAGGIQLAADAAMKAAKDFTELIAWQRADELERFAQELVKKPILVRDREYCEQTSGAAASAPRNIAEGFGRFGPIQNANFVRIAIGSEMEMKNQITKAWQRGAISDEEHWVGMVLCKRAIGAAVGYRRYLLSTRAKANAERIESTADCRANEHRTK